jgi:hypothetical protein
MRSTITIWDRFNTYQKKIPKKLVLFKKILFESKERMIIFFSAFLVLNFWIWTDSEYFTEF